MTDRVEDGLEFGVGLRFQMIERARNLLVRGEEEAEPHEGTHDLDIHGDGARASEHGGEHGHALLGECVGSGAPTAPT